MREVLWIDTCRKRVTGSETQVIYRTIKKSSDVDSGNSTLMDTQSDVVDNESKYEYYYHNNSFMLFFIYCII
jgi:hypothetical protein